MIFDGINLENIIVSAIGRVGPMSGSEIYFHITEEVGAEYSQQAMYKALNKLSANNIIIKRQQEYTLSLDWCALVSDFADTLSKVHFSTDSLIRELPRKGRKLKWTFQSLNALNTFWCHLVMALLSKTESKFLLSWNPHPWFYLIREVSERSYLLGLQNKTVSSFKLIGGETFLDKWCEPFWDDSLVTVAYSKDAFPRSLYFTIVDDYLIHITLSPQAVNLLEAIYSSVKSAEEIKDITLPEKEISATLELSQPDSLSDFIEPFSKSFSLPT